MKALFFDMDGTLLDSSKRVPPSAVEALTQVRAKGVKVFAATGRSPRIERMMGGVAKEQILDGGVYCNGACIEMDGKTEYQYIDPEAVRLIMEEVNRYPELHLSLNGDGALHAYNYNPPESILIPWGMTWEDVVPLDETAVRTTTKLMIFYHELVNSTRKLPEGLYDRLQELCGDKVEMYVTDQGCAIQMVSKNCGKRNSVDKVRQRLGLAMDEIAVFGDDLNDLEMISAFPVSISMGNGAPAVKAAAKYVTRENDDDGIAYALREILHIL